jgi:hypothetical protein
MEIRKFGSIEELGENWRLYKEEDDGYVLVIQTQSHR